MKLRIYHQPVFVVLVFLSAALGFGALGFAMGGVLRKVCFGFSSMYGLGSLVATLLTCRVAANEDMVVLTRSEKLLLIAPHQDDCVLMAGGLGIQNQRLGGTIHVVYLTQPGDPVQAEVRRDEAINAWKLAGVPEENLRHCRLLPKNRPITCGDVKRLTAELQKIIDELQPSLICVPLFEGGHLHHDISQYVVSRTLKMPRWTHIYEAPEYSPYFSVWWTPHKALTCFTRLTFFGTVSYYPKPEGVGSAHLSNLRMSAEEIELKKRMLREFRSQNGDSLARNHGYADRFFLRKTDDYRMTPFVFAGSLPWMVEKLGNILPQPVLRRLLPGDHHTIGLERGITDLEQLKLNSPTA